jgi:hypothetical protein
MSGLSQGDLRHSTRTARTASRRTTATTARWSPAAGEVYSAAQAMGAFPAPGAWRGRVYGSAAGGFGSAQSPDGRLLS